MLPDRVLSPGPLTYESGALPIALRNPAGSIVADKIDSVKYCVYVYRWVKQEQM